jgi:hypothetical protein
VTISLATYVIVDSQAPLGMLQAEVLEPDSAIYLDSHLVALAGLGAVSPPAHFTDAGARDCFQCLVFGDESDFLNAASELAARLHGRMDGRMPAGLYVALRDERGGREVRAAVLKLVSTRKPAGYLRTLRGRVRLAAIRDALDQPGQLQKGCLYPDTRANSDVVVGDRLDVGALYFLRAFGLIQDQAADLAVRVLLEEIVSRVPDRADAIATSIHQRRPTSMVDCIDCIAADVPEVAAHRDEVIAVLNSKERPVVALSPERIALMKREITGNGIMISGPLDEMNARVTLKPLRGGRYQATVIFDGHPRDVTRP